jgi:hypothetical protein
VPYRPDPFLCIGVRLLQLLLEPGCADLRLRRPLRDCDDPLCLVAFCVIDALPALVERHCQWLCVLCPVFEYSLFSFLIDRCDYFCVFAMPLGVLAFAPGTSRAGHVRHLRAGGAPRKLGLCLLLESLTEKLLPRKLGNNKRFDLLLLKTLNPLVLTLFLRLQIGRQLGIIKNRRRGI